MNNINNNIPPAAPPVAPPSRQDTLKKCEKERNENEKQVSIMEQQLHAHTCRTQSIYEYDVYAVYSV